MSETMQSKLLLLPVMPINDNRPLRDIRDIRENYSKIADVATEMDGKPIVYIMGPYSNNPKLYVWNAMNVANIVVEKGGIPYIPHLTHFWHMHTARPWAYWLAYDLYLLDHITSDLCAVRIPGESYGADFEEMFLASGAVKIYSLAEIEQPNFKFERRNANGRL